MLLLQSFSGSNGTIFLLRHLRHIILPCWLMKMPALMVIESSTNPQSSHFTVMSITCGQIHATSSKELCPRPEGGTRKTPSYIQTNEGCLMRTYEGSLWEFFVDELKRYDWHFGYLLGTVVAIASVAAVVFWVIFLIPVFLSVVLVVALIRCLRRAYEWWTCETLPIVAF